MKLSIVIPAFNEELEIGACLESVQASIDNVDLRTFDRVDTIVVDNNSVDATAAIARQHHATVVFEAENQIAGARNAGARVATGDWLLFIDADSRLATETLEKMIEAIASGRVGAGGSTIAMPDAPLWGRCTVFLWNIISVVRRCAAGSFIFIAKPIYDAVGGFDTQYFAAEEMDFSRRATNECRQVGLQFKILIGSPHKSSSRKFRLYSHSELARLFARGCFSWGKTIRTRERLDYFYDGRRERDPDTGQAPSSDPH